MRACTHGARDRCVCEACGVDVFDWESGDDPLEEHRRNASQPCAFLDAYDASSATAHDPAPVGEADGHRSQALVAPVADEVAGIPICAMRQAVSLHPRMSASKVPWLLARHCIPRALISIPHAMLRHATPTARRYAAAAELACARAELAFAREAAQRERARADALALALSDSEIKLMEVQPRVPTRPPPGFALWSVSAHGRRVPFRLFSTRSHPARRLVCPIVVRVLPRSSRMSHTSARAGC